MMKDIEMVVDDVKSSKKNGKTQSVLKGTAVVDGVEVPVTMMFTCGAPDILEVLKIDEIDKSILVAVKPGYQQTL